MRKALINTLVCTDPDCLALVNKAKSLGYALPSTANLRLINALFIGLKAAITSGTFAEAYADINIFANDINFGGTIPANLGFSGLKWNNPNATACSRSNTISQTVKRGFASNGTTSLINRNYTPSSELITANNNVGAIWGIYNNTLSSDKAAGVWDAGSAGSPALWLGFSPNFSYCYINSTLNVPGALGDNLGNVVYCAIQNGTTAKLYKNNTEINSVASGTLLSKPTKSMFDLALHNNSNAAFWWNSAAIIQYSLTWKQSVVNRTTLYNALQTYVTAVAALT